ncbi:MAG TPA: amino acid adenylation domain-containing protein [Thermoanaerobaculia bacterium]|nr:amino acid adenylation domain-containing protein [Thermoanaerobaculia bacterium]
MTDPQTQDLSIAIIGMAGRFPGAGDVDQFWRNLRDGVESIRFFAGDPEASLTGPADDPSLVRAAGLLDGIEDFDAAFFDFNPREAEIADPQQRAFLECCWQALETAGYSPEGFTGAIGVFGGAGMNTYFFNNVLAHPELLQTLAPLQVLVGTDKDYLAPRVSYKLNLKGPSISVQTACSTSLVAVHLACQSLQDYQSDLALAGGVSIRVPQQSGYRYQEGGIYSPDGHCRVFDRNAQGTVTGSGVGVVVLKRLADAVAAGDTILAVIRGSAVNNDGASKVGFTAPSVEGQVAVISEALAAAGISGDTIGYVEAHGTGTALGDPIEVTALTRSFGVGAERRESCALGSVKSNIGHLDAASGVAGLIKAVLALQHRAIPPSLHFEAPNPEIDFASGPFYVSRALTEWPAGDGPRRAGVSSFGIGGTNAHAVLEEAPAPAPSGPSRSWQLLLLSARTPAALEAATDNLARHLEEHPEQPLADVAYTLQVGRNAFRHRRALVCQDREDAIAALRSRHPQRLLSLAQEGRDRPVAFLFPGQGAQHVGMGQELYDAEPAFRRALDHCARLLQPHLGLDLRTVLFPTAGAAEDGAAAAGRLAQTALAQPALFAVEYALAELLREWGIRPAAMLGHSLGEYVAACLAGVFSLADALALVAARGRLMQELPAGAMLVVPRPEAETRRLLAGGLALAAVNGPSFCVVSGPTGEVDALAGRLAEQGIEARRLHTSHAFHSAMMDPILEAFGREVAKVRLAPPRIPYVSNLTGTWIEAAQATDPAWWVRQLRETVRFAGGAAELLQDRSRVLLEVGPGRTLASLVRSASPERTVVTTMRHPQDGDSGGGGGAGEPLANALGRLWLAGAHVDWEGFHPHEQRHRVPLPTYPFERQRFWLEPARPRGVAQAAVAPAEPVAPSETAAAQPAAVLSRGHARPELATPFVPPGDEVERTVTALWERALGIAGLGVHDDFFELGGHSLLATQITAEVRSAFATDAPLKALFETPTIAGLAAAVRAHREQAAAGAAGAAPALPVLIHDPEHRHEPFPLTDVQQAYWIGRSGAFEMGEVATHIYTEVSSREVDLDRMTLAWRLLIERHDMLRAIVLPDGRQQILETVPPYCIAVLDLRGADAAQREAGLQRVRHEMSHQVLPSDRWPLFEVRVTRLGGGVVRFHISFDFLIGDAWSWQVLMRDLARLYADPAAELPPLEASFRDYVQALADYERTPGFARDLDYWRGRLADLPPAPELPLARNPAALGRPRFVRHAGRLPRAAWSRLKERASRSGLTPSGVLLAAFSEVLAAWSKSPRFTINLTLFNRLPLHPQVNELVGDFTSLTLLAVDTAQAGSFEARARRTQAQLWEDLDHRSVSGVRVLRELTRSHGGLVRSLMPVVFTSTLNLATQDGGGQDEEDDDAQREERYEISQTPQVWLDHQVAEERGRLIFNWDVVEDLFPPGFVPTLFQAYRDLLARLAESEEAWAATAFDLVPAAQRDERAAVNATAEDFGPAASRLLHTLVAAPDDRPAVDAPGRTLTYRELHREALALGHRLRELGARPNRLVAVVMEKGWEQVVGVLGVLWSGAAYLPIDPDLPADRRRYLLENGEVKIALSQPWIDDRFAQRGEWPEGLRRLRVEAGTPATPEDTAPAPLAPVQGPADLAYVIFTSGSTGQPKWVMIDHRGAVNTVLDMNHRFRVGPQDRVLALSSLSFDLSVYDVFGLLAAGGTIVLPAADRRRDPGHWAERIENAGVTIWNTVPPLMEMLAEQAAHGRPGAAPAPRTLRTVLLSGDWIPVSLPGRIRRLPWVTPGVEVVSLGGATEASIWSILHPIGEVDPAARSIPYGRPMSNQTFHVLDGCLQPRPTWVPGQLFIGGTGLAQGYWRDAAKTAASFITHPQTGERLYRTGDLGRYLPGGDIEFLGREDSQVKIRGYRVELGEIETVLAGHPAVREAVVLAREGGAPGEKRLASYVIAEPGTVLDDGELRAYLRERLPDYMVPSGFLVLESLPLTANGKVDRRALPALEHEKPQPRREYAAPETEVEKALASLCGAALGVDRLGLHDDFFELGGDSLMAIRAIFQIRADLGVELPVRSFFDAPNVAALAEVVEGLILDQIENLSDEEVHERL